jgi:dihydrofolate reductase
MSTGAVVAGRGTFEPAGGWGGDHHDGVPIFIYSRREAGIDISQWPLVTYVTDVKSAMTQVKEAAGEKNVLVHGAAIAQLALAAGLLDELELHVVPVLFGQGRHLFEGLAPEQIELERTRILEGEGGVTPTCITGSSAEVSVTAPSPCTDGWHAAPLQSRNRNWSALPSPNWTLTQTAASRSLRRKGVRIAHGHIAKQDESGIMFSLEVTR